MRKIFSRRKLSVTVQMTQSFLFRKRIPIVANLLITNRCNLNCFYCYVDVHHRKVKEPTLNEIIQMVDDLLLLGTRFFVLLGGEPLIRKDIGRIVRHIQNRGAMCEIITNGFYIPKLIDDIKYTDSICVSLDGKRDHNDKNRGKGAFDAAVKAIDLLCSLNVPTRIKAVITKDNLEDMEWLSDFAEKRGMVVTMSLAATYSDRKYEKENHFITDTEEKAFYRRLLCLKMKNELIGYSSKALNYCIKWPYSMGHIINREKSNNPKNVTLIECLRKSRSLYIDVDGWMYPCANQWGQKRINVFKSGVSDAWAVFNQFDCFSCASIPDIDMTLLFKWDFENIKRAVGLF